MSEIVGSNAIADFVRQNDSGSRQVKYQDGQAVFEPRDRATEFFVAESGEIRLFEVGAHGARRLLDIIGPGQCFGFASLGRIPLYENLAISVGNSSAWVIAADRLREIILGHGELALQFVESMTRQLQDAWNEGSHFVFEDCRLRLIKTLLRFKNTPAARAVPGGVELRMTHAQLAQAVGVARETISLCLTQLRRENLVQTRRNRVLYNPDRLQPFDPQPEFIPELAIAG
ncbi:MAG: Crp/Fnr family transcriptional regulator [Tepidisphaeraceae bacterium]